MRRINASHMAVALSGAALFVALGGPAWAAGLLVGTKQIKNNAVTSRKIKRGAVHSSDLARGAVRNRNLRHGSVSASKLRAAAVTTGALADASVTNAKLADAAVTSGKLADNAVTSGKVADGSLTAGDVAPNTFLAANGTAQNSLALGGLPAANYFRASGSANQNRVVIPSGTTGSNLLLFSLGQITGSCSAGKPTVTYNNASQPVEYAETVITPGIANPVSYTTLNAINAGTSTTVPNSGTIQSITLQLASKTDGRVMTAWIATHVEGATCHFTAQEMSTGQ